MRAGLSLNFDLSEVLATGLNWGFWSTGLAWSFLDGVFGRSRLPSSFFTIDWCRKKCKNPKMTKQRPLPYGKTFFQITKNPKNNQARSFAISEVVRDTSSVAKTKVSRLLWEFLCCRHKNYFSKTFEKVAAAKSLCSKLLISEIFRNFWNYFQKKWNFFIFIWKCTREMAFSRN